MMPSLENDFGTLAAEPTGAVELAAVVPARRGGRALRIPLVAALLVLVSAIALPLMVVLYVSAAAVQQNALDLLRQSTEGFLRVAGTRVDLHLRPVTEQSSYITSLIESGRIDPADQDDFGKFLIGAHAALPQVHDLAFLYADYHLLRVNRERHSVVLRDWTGDADARAIVEEASASAKPYWGEFFYVPASGATLLNYRTPVRRNGQFLGVLIAAVSVATLSDFLSHAATRYADHAYILDGADLVVAHANLVNGTSGLSRAQPLPTLRQVGDPVLAQIWSGTSNSGIALGLAAEFGGRAVTIGEETYLFVHRTISGYGPRPWIAGTYVPLSSIRPQLQRTRWILALGLLILLSATAGVTLLSHSLARPVRQFALASEAIRRMDFANAPLVARSMFRELDASARAFNAMLTGMREAAAYLPRNLVRRLMTPDAAAAPLSQERTVTVLFTDIGHFTTMAEGLPPAEVAAFLNAHFSLLAGCIDAEGGVIDKFIGDSVMAFWGGLEPDPRHAERALGAALRIAATIRTDNERRRKLGLDPVHLRIGLHSGQATAGNIGAPGRVNFTLVGDTVNVAQKVETLGRTVGSDEDDVTILLSDATNSLLGEGLEAFSLGHHLVSGRASSIEIFRIVV